jgi:hypothetical protein
MDVEPADVRADCTMLQEKEWSQAPVADTCHPSYSGDRVQEDQDLRPAQANSSLKTLSKKNNNNNLYTKGLAEWLKV